MQNSPDFTPRNVPKKHGPGDSHRARNDPIFRGTVEGAIPGSIGENPIAEFDPSGLTVAWNALENAGVLPGVVDVFGHPIQAAVNLNVSIKQTYRGQAKQVAAALWGDSSSHVR